MSELILVLIAHTGPPGDDSCEIIIVRQHRRGFLDRLIPSPWPPFQNFDVFRNQRFIRNIADF